MKQQKRECKPKVIFDLHQGIYVNFKPFFFCRYYYYRTKNKIKKKIVVHSKWEYFEKKKVRLQSLNCHCTLYITCFVKLYIVHCGKPVQWKCILKKHKRSHLYLSTSRDALRERYQHIQWAGCYRSHWWRKWPDRLKIHCKFPQSTFIDPKIYCTLNVL